MAVKLDLDKIKTPKGKISKIFQLCEKHGVHSNSDKTWEEIKEVCDSINGRFGKDTTKFKCLLTLANPKFTVEEKNKICSRFQFSVASTYKSDSSKELLHKFLTPSFIEYLCFKYPSNIESVINVTKLHPDDLYHLVIHNPHFATKIKETSNEALINTLFQTKMDMNDFLGENDYIDFLNKKINKYYKNKLAKYDERILANNEKAVNKLLKKQFPQLEIFDHIIINNHKEISEVSFNILKNLEPMNLKDYLKQNFCFSSAKIIHYIKNNFKTLESTYHLQKSIALYKTVINDHNLIWHILDDFSLHKYKTLPSEYFSDNEFRKNKNLLSETQWALFFKTLNYCVEKESSRTVEHLRDSFRMIADVNYHTKNDNFIQSLKTNYRFQEYNTPEKLHEVLIVLYNKAMNKEYPLNLEQQYPNILDQHGIALTSSLSLHIPKVSTDLTVWGQRLRICVGSYSRNVADGDTLVVGITENGQIKYCAEIDPVKVRLVQLRGFRNDDAPKEVFTAFKLWMEAFKPSLLAAQEHKLKYDISIIEAQIPKLEEYFQKLKVESPSDEDEDFHPLFHRLPSFIQQKQGNRPSIEEYFKDLKILLSQEYFEVLKDNLNYVASLKHHHSRMLKMEQMTGNHRMDMFLGLQVGHALFFFMSDSHLEIKRLLKKKDKVA